MSRPSTLMIANRAGVSRATVSYVLNGKFEDRIPEHTRARVKQIATELGYRPNHLATSLLKGKSATIGLLVPTFDSPYYAEIIGGLETELALHGYQLLASRSQGGASTNKVEFFLEHRVDGIVFIANSESIPHVRSWLSRVDTQTFPIVLVDDSSFADQIDCVVSDDILGMSAAVDYLASLGHKRIAHLWSDWKNSTRADRQQGYLLGLSRNGLEYDPTIDMKITPEYSQMNSTDAILRLLRLDNPPTAVVPDVDSMFENYYTQCLTNPTMQLNALSVAGYADSDTARIFDMTSVNQKPSVIGALAAQRLLARLEQPNLPPMVTKVEPSLVVRSSCRSIISETTHSERESIHA